jgi:hypothetical protein
MTRQMAERLDHPYALGWASLAEGAAGLFEGRWKTAHAKSEEAEAIFRDRCTGVTWEIASVRSFSLWSLTYLGGLAQLARRIPARLHEARERGDRYAAICHSTGHAAFAWLAEDDPETALARSREALSRWTRKTFHVEHWWAMVGDRQADLYAGQPEAAHRLIQAQWHDLDEALLLQVQLVRVEATFLRARAALALGRARPSERRELCRAAEQDAERLQREHVAWAEAFASLVRAGVAAAGGDLSQAEAQLRAAVDGLERADMMLYAAAARWQRGRILGGDEGQKLVASAERWMTEQGIVNKARMAAMLAPGFEP